MTAPEKFLSRWSRKKLDAAEQPEQTTPMADTAASAPPPTDEGADTPAGESSELRTPATSAPKTTAPIFDPASLPSLDPIGAQTDVRGFLRPGVPSDLIRSALRHVWLADPAIRDFKGLQENDWDFNDPNGMYGFGELGPNFDVKKMLTSVFGETPKEESAPSAAKSDDVNREPIQLTNELAATDEHRAADRIDESPAANDDTVPAREDGETHAHDLAAVESKVVQPNMNIAMQNVDPESKHEPTVRHRSHGSALPQ